VHAALRQRMDEHPQTIVLGEDVGLVGGQFRVTNGFLQRYGEGRVIDTPLCELGIIGTAVGMAAAGAEPVAEIMYAGFSNAALDQLIGHVSRWRYRYRGLSSMPMVIRMAHGSGVGAAEFHVDSPENYFVQTPGLIVVVPSTPIEAKGLMAQALACPDPVVFIEPILLYERPREAVPTAHYTVPLGKAGIRRPGEDVTLVTYGANVAHALRAAEGASVSVEVIDLRTLKPWDEQTVVESVDKTGRLVVAHDPPISAGIGSDIVAVVASKCLYSLKAPPRIVGGLDAPRPTRSLEDVAVIKAHHLTAAIQAVARG
jgi:pyruvate dehydrogenase E1 component beta subunit